MRARVPGGWLLQFYWMAVPQVCVVFVPDQTGQQALGMEEKG